MSLHNQRLRMRVEEQVQNLADDYVELSVLNHTEQFNKSEETKRKIRDVARKIKNKLEVLNGILDVMN